ncbi:uncharacterized protein LAJ45_01852 [Morchella importuna]|uniref:uncharacterized protein n=1 Tax=Morchella importuna TaxID=1174673 RepID=UPI001E8EDF86|nr:uncharacterized protein LAJ45_01852 [Morchella importuna]KAH8154085.1 hypothetical protein LAJ45_01852 [Morchella importuna]
MLLFCSSSSATFARSVSSSFSFSANAVELRPPELGLARRLAAPETSFPAIVPAVADFLTEGGLAPAELSGLPFALGGLGLVAASRRLLTELRPVILGVLSDPRDLCPLSPAGRTAGFLVPERLEPLRSGLVGPPLLEVLLLSGVAGVVGVLLTVGVVFVPVAGAGAPPAAEGTLLDPGRAPTVLDELVGLVGFPRPFVVVPVAERRTVPVAARLAAAVVAGDGRLAAPRRPGFLGARVSSRWVSFTGSLAVPGGEGSAMVG